MCLFLKMVEFWIPTRWCHHRLPRRKTQSRRTRKEVAALLFVIGRRKPFVFLLRERTWGFGNGIIDLCVRKPMLIPYTLVLWVSWFESGGSDEFPLLIDLDLRIHLTVQICTVWAPVLFLLSFFFFEEKSTVYLFPLQFYYWTTLFHYCTPCFFTY